ncbi:hypothetical protein MSG28_010453 [Choristoneura fumiferana]|uniref:Uncharacterized protein n=1 Tax=Choristoneura fumiferana TaxID=7141 RepID=A0ACC0KLG3_CHOFU|nr:hypothetical protein MSG28_010453 [Choristoneura fumiferana]
MPNTKHTLSQCSIVTKVEFRNESVNATLCGAAATLAARAALLRPGELAAAEARVGSLLANVEALKAARNDDPELHAKVNELHKLVQQIDGISHSEILERMEALEALHNQASNFGKSLTELETLQSTISSGVQNNKELLQGVQEQQEQEGKYHPSTWNFRIFNILWTSMKLSIKHKKVTASTAIVDGGAVRRVGRRRARLQLVLHLERAHERQRTRRPRRQRGRAPPRQRRRRRLRLRLRREHGHAAARRRALRPQVVAALRRRGQLADVVGRGAVRRARRRRLAQQLALAQEAPLRRRAPRHADEVRPARLRRRARVGPVRGAHVRGLIARARPSPSYRYRTAYGQKEKGAAGRSVCTCDRDRRAARRLTRLLTASGVATPSALIRCCMVGEGRAPPLEPVSYRRGSITTRADLTADNDAAWAADGGADRPVGTNSLPTLAAVATAAWVHSPRTAKPPGLPCRRRAPLVQETTEEA